MKRFTVLLLTALLLLPSCQRLPHREEDTAVPDASAMTFVAEDESANLVTIYSGTRYQVVPLIPENSGYYSQMLALHTLENEEDVFFVNEGPYYYFLDNKLYLSSFTGGSKPAERDKHIEIFDAEGNRIDTITVPELVGTEYKNDALLDADGNYVIILSESDATEDGEKAERSKKNRIIRKYDATGKNILREALLTDTESLYIYLCNSMSPYYLIAADRIDFDEIQTAHVRQRAERTDHTHNGTQ